MTDKKMIVRIIGVVILLIIIISIFIMIFGSKKTICTNSSNQSKNGYKLDTKYVIYSNWNNVKTIKITEIITSKDKKVLDKFKQQLEKQYSSNKDTYGGYQYKIIIKDNQLIGNTTIHYNEFDMKEFIKNNEAMKSYTKNNKLTLDGARKMYESTGATCK